MTLPRTMSGVLLTRHGGPEALEWRDDIPVPVPGPGQALVRVLAAGVNNTDINTRIGWYAPAVTSATDDVPVDANVQAGGWDGALSFPRIQGGDLCGEVVALGKGVSGPAVGSRVTCPINLPRQTAQSPTGFVALGSELDGAFAQYCCLAADDLFDVSAAPLSDVEIAAMPCAYGTALNLLTRANVVEGQKVLITGASGGVGLAAVQLATHMGAVVTALTGPAKAHVVRDAGATETLPRDAELPSDSFDAVIDIVGGPGWSDLIRATRPGGHYAVSGAIAGPVVTGDLREIYLRDITIHGCTFQPRSTFAKLVDLMVGGALRPLVSKTYPLVDIALAQAEFSAKTMAGKLVLLPPEVTP